MGKIMLALAIMLRAASTVFITTLRELVDVPFMRWSIYPLLGFVQIFYADAPASRSR